MSPPSAQSQLNNNVSSTATPHNSPNPPTSTPQNSPYPPDSIHSPASLIFSASTGHKEANITSVIPNLTTDATVLNNINDSTSTGNAILTLISKPLTCPLVLGQSRSRNDSGLHCYIYLRHSPKSGLAKVGISMDTESKTSTRSAINVCHYRLYNM